MINNGYCIVGSKYEVNNITSSGDWKEHEATEWGAFRWGSETEHVATTGFYCANTILKGKGYSRLSLYFQPFDEVVAGQPVAIGGFMTLFETFEIFANPPNRSGDLYEHYGQGHAAGPFYAHYFSYHPRVKHDGYGISCFRVDDFGRDQYPIVTRPLRFQGAVMVIGTASSTDPYEVKLWGDAPTGAGRQIIAHGRVWPMGKDPVRNEQDKKYDNAYGRLELVYAG